MEYYILTESEFFNLINGNDETVNLTAAYNDFIRMVVELCGNYMERGGVMLALAYTENELQHHRTQYMTSEKSHTDLYVRKALAFVRKMQEHVLQNHTPVPPLSNPTIPNDYTLAENTAPALRWTGNAIDLVEMIYGISTMGCINSGKIPLKELAPMLYSFFGVDSKDCYRFYIDIKRRKNDSRTYFLDRMADRLNAKMRHDDELERMRR